MTVKRVDPWSILKLGLVLNIAGAAILLITGMVVWSVIRRLQVIERACDQAQSLLGFESCTVNGVDIMRTGLLLAGLLVLVVTGVMVFAAFLYNLVADLTGGIEVSMLDHSGQLRTAQGGVQVSPELTGEVAQARPERPPGAPRPDQERTGGGLGTGAGVGAAAASMGGPGRTGPVMSPSADPTIASSSARPNTAVPLVDDDVVPPVVRSHPAPPVPTGAMLPPAPAAEGGAPPRRRPPARATDGPEGSRATDRASERGGAEPNMWPADHAPGSTPDRPDERQIPRRRAAAAGAMFRDAADRTGAALSDVAQRAGTALQDITAAEASARAERSDSDRQSLDDLAADAASSRARTGDDRRGRSGDGATRGTAVGRTGSGTGSGPSGGRSTPRSDGRDRSGRRSSSSGSSAEPASPQEAAAARVRGSTSAPTSPPRGPDGKFLPKEEPDRRRKGSDDDDGEARDLFGQHPGRGDDTDD